MEYSLEDLFLQFIQQRNLQFNRARSKNHRNLLSLDRYYLRYSIQFCYLTPSMLNYIHIHFNEYREVILQLKKYNKIASKSTWLMRARNNSPSSIWIVWGWLYVIIDHEYFLNLNSVVLYYKIIPPKFQVAMKPKVKPDHRFTGNNRLKKRRHREFKMGSNDTIL